MLSGKNTGCVNINFARFLQNKTTTNNEQTTKIQTNQHQNNNEQTKQQNQKQTKIYK